MSGKPMAESGYAVAAFEGTFLLLIIASELCAQVGKMEGPEAGARPQADALITRVGNDREKLKTACSETKEVVARWTRITLFRLCVWFRSEWSSQRRIRQSMGRTLVKRSRPLVARSL